MKGGSLHRLYQQLERAITDLSQWIGQPLVLEDAQFKLVTYSPHQDLQSVDLARWGTVLSKGAPREVLQAMRREGIVKQLRQASAPVRVKAIPEVGLRQRVVVPIRRGNRTLGYIWLVDPNGLDDELLERFADVVNRELAPLLFDLLEELEGRPQASAALLRRLVAGEPVEPDALAAFREAAFSSTCRHFWLAAIVGPGFPHDGGRMPAAAATQARHWKVQVVPLEVDAVCYVVCTVPYAAPAEGERDIVAFLEALRQKFRHEAGPVGIGLDGSFEELAGVREAAAAAHGAALISAHLLDGAAVARSCQFPAFLSAMAAWREANRAPWDRYHADGSAGSWLAILEDYDNRQKSSLLATLTAYLDSGGSTSQASAALHVHPNTLLYRLQRIQQLTGLDLEDGRQRLLLHFELQARRLWSAFKGTPAPEDETASSRGPAT